MDAKAFQKVGHIVGHGEPEFEINNGTLLDQNQVVGRKYAHIEIVVNLVVVNFFSFLVIAPSP